MSQLLSPERVRPSWGQGEGGEGSVLSAVDGVGESCKTRVEEL